ncbi:ArnT family glycosyltransferase [Nocardioides sp. YJ-D4]
MTVPRVSMSQSTICVLLLGVLGFAMSAQVAIAMPALFKADERAHAAYAVALSQGTLPTIDTDIPDDPARYPQLAESLFGADEAHRDIWVANHPPLFYAMSLPLVWLGDAVGSPGLTLLGMRLLNALGFALTTIMVGLLARELVPRRPAVPVIASAMCIGCGAMTFVGGGIYNDGWSSAAAFMTLYLGFRMIRQGVTRERLIAAAAVGVAAAGFRSTGLVAVLFLGACVLVAMWLREPSLRTFLRGTFWRAVGIAACIGMAPVVVFGWFYVRNIELYGDPTASGSLFEKFGREPNGTTLFQLVNPEFYGHLLGSLWTDGNIANTWSQAAVIVLTLTLAGLVLDAAAKANPRRTGVLRRIRLAPQSTMQHRQDLAIWALLGGYCLLILINVAGFIAGGGWIHARYAVPFLPFLAAGAGIAALRLGRLLPLRVPTGSRTGVTALDEARDLRIGLGVSLAFMVVGLVCHLDTEQYVDGPVSSTFALVALVAADLVMFAVAAYVATELRRRMRPGTFDTPRTLAAHVASGPVTEVASGRPRETTGISTSSKAP